MPDELVIALRVLEAARAAVDVAGKPSGVVIEAGRTTAAPPEDEKRIDLWVTGDAAQRPGGEQGSRFNPVREHYIAVQVQCRVRSESQQDLSPLMAHVHTKLMGAQTLGGIAKHVEEGKPTEFDVRPGSDGVFQVAIMDFEARTVTLAADMRVVK